MTSTKFNPHARRKARRLVLQALYQWQLGQHSLSEIQLQFNEDENMLKADGNYFHELINAITKMVKELDEQFSPYLDRALNELDPIELGILRLGTYELKQRLEIPYRVVINEAVELAKTFGALDGHKYINGILDKVAHQIRHAEIQAK